MKIHHLQAEPRQGSRSRAAWRGGRAPGAPCRGCVPRHVQCPGATHLALCCRSRAAPAAAKTARPPALGTAGGGQGTDEHLQTSTASPGTAEPLQGDGGNPGGFQPQPVLSPLSWAMTNVPAPIPARTTGAPGAPTLTQGRAIKSYSAHLCLLGGPRGRPQAHMRAEQSLGQGRYSQLRTFIPACCSLPPPLWEALSCRAARGKPRDGVSWQHRSDTRTPTHSPAHTACACPDPPHPPAEELLWRRCKKTWEITHACDISN